MMFLQCLSLMVLASGVLAQTCSTLGQSHFTAFKDNRLDNYQISHLVDFTLERCALECFLVKMCASFNYRERSGICELNEFAVEEELTNEAEFEYHDIRDWNSEMAGTCASRPCAANQRCIRTTPYTCANVDCGPPPRYTLSSPPLYFILTATGANTTLGGKAIYNCGDPWAIVDYVESSETPFYNSSTKICNSDYSWSKNMPTCKSQLTACPAVRACNSSYGDGHYWIYKAGDLTKKVKVYCHQMDTTIENYITLPPGNIAYNAGNGVTAPSWTVFDKIKISDGFSINENDMTFTTSFGPEGNIPFGKAASCNGDGESKVYGYFKINTTDTGTFVGTLDNDWAASPSGSAELVNLTFNGPEVSGYCWGSCGTCAPKARLLLYPVGSTKGVDASDTIHPTCQ